jgi:hypothetical protein
MIKRLLRLHLAPSPHARHAGPPTICPRDLAPRLAAFTAGLAILAGGCAVTPSPDAPLPDTAIDGASVVEGPDCSPAVVPVGPGDDGGAGDDGGVDAGIRCERPGPHLLPGVSCPAQAASGYLRIDGEAHTVARGCAGRVTTGLEAPPDSSIIPGARFGHWVSIAPSDSCVPTLAVVVLDARTLGEPTADEDVRRLFDGAVPACVSFPTPDLCTDGTSAVSIGLEDGRGCWAVEPSSGSYCIETAGDGRALRWSLDAILRGPDGRDVRVEASVDLGPSSDGRFVGIDWIRPNCLPR